MLEACNKSSGVWQLATLLPTFVPAGVANFSGLLPIQAQNPPPREGMVWACITNITIFAPENLLPANIVIYVTTYSETQS